MRISEVINESSYLYHVTSKEIYEEKIKHEGLKVNSEYELTKKGNIFSQIGVYPVWPIFVSFHPGSEYYSHINNPVEIVIDGTGFELYPDFPSLVEHGMLVDQGDMGFMGYWKNFISEPDELQSFLDDGAFYLKESFHDDDLKDAIIDITKSAAILEDIPPSKILNYR